MADWYVYIVSNKAHTLYTGIANDLPKRIQWAYPGLVDGLILGQATSA